MTQYDEWGDVIPGTEDVETPQESEQPIETETPTTDEPVIIGEWNLTEAQAYVLYNAVDNEDYLANDTTNQVRFLNVSQRTLARSFKGYALPIEATYLFACVLSANYNDTNVLAQRGVAGFSVDGISFQFKDWAKKELDDLITDDIRDLIAEANPEISGNSRIKWVTL